MVRAVEEGDLEKKPLKHVTLNAISVAELEHKSVADFVTRNIESFFTRLSLPQEFLQLPASQCAENHEYQTAAVVARTVAVVNDHAERGVVLIHQLSGS